MQCKTYRCKIYIAGDLNQIEQTCRKFCYNIGLCVTVTATNYIYTGGQELGVIVGLINYPRFPKKDVEIKSTAFKLAVLLMKENYQHSFTIETPTKTYWYTRRGQ